MFLASVATILACSSGRAASHTNKDWDDPLLRVTLGTKSTPMKCLMMKGHIMKNGGIF